MHRPLRFALGLGLVCCGSPPPASTPVAAPSAGASAEKPPETASPARSEAAAETPKPDVAPEAPPEAKCVVKGTVSRGGVTWPLRIAAEAAPSMTVEDGTITARVGPHPRSGAWNVPAELENASMKIAAMVPGEDLRVFVTKPFFVKKGYVPDGVTERKLVDAMDGAASVDITFEKLHSTVVEMPCAELSVMPSRIDADPLLEKAGGEVVLKSTSYIKVGEEMLQATAFTNPTGVERPAGTLATERGAKENGGTQLVSIETCGGTALGRVSKAELISQPRKMKATNERCPGTPSGTFEAEAPLTKPLKCATEIPLFLRHGGSEQAIGTLKAGARVQSEGQDQNGTTLVRVRAPAAAPMAGASFAVKTTDLAGCTPSK